MQSEGTDNNVRNDARPVSETEEAKKNKLKILQMLLEKKNTQYSTVVIGILIITFMVAVSVTCFVIAGLYDKLDFYIVGSVFIVGLVVFSVMFVMVNCRPWMKNRKIHAMLDKHAEGMDGRSPHDGLYLTDEDLTTYRLQLDS